ncbi:hypothetical protein COX64_05120 [Candidatus Dojkabacteria bacterium CG_4_10_14_0_2_um_filter_Dojkabacteria_WS6_41_15]|uniref:Major facilitator superfamily (MFS) profile domain-containing protein n=1 Tax=Candidatus Dojkabacteria bacterium CG_4_10_14_0_2_um_filter_Dojkabacteria_WS6_41_15 TaxID=2014249 RepID=A0A2M7W0M3_9BACT|nr:MAG: hypothetical protein COX64_05120 [Candidatus Dojkabacteria bacterium CG_4_10_14_0_2_um_filter_Dojkabacteria_WS6_41_15]
MFKNPLEKNITYFYIARLFWLPMFWMPVIYIYLVQNKGFSPIEAFFLMSVQEAALIFLEVPTGVVADRISRKFSVALGYFLTALPFVFLPWANAFWLVFLIFVVKAVGKALMSGAQQALLYDTLVELKRTSEYKIIMTKTKAFMLVFSSLCLLIGGLLAQWGHIEWTMVLPFPVMALGGIATYMSIEPAVSLNAKKLQETTYLKHSWASLTYILKTPAVFIMAVIFAINDATQVNLKWFYPSVFEKLGFSFALMGVTTAIIYFIKGVLSGVSLPMMSKNAMKNIVTYMPLVAIGFLVPMLWFHPLIVVLALLVINLGTELMDSSIEEELNDGIESRDRATVMSIVALFGSVLATMMLWIFGYIQTVGSVQGSLGFVGLLFMVGTYVSFRASKMKVRL